MVMPRFQKVVDDTPRNDEQDEDPTYGGRVFWRRSLRPRTRGHARDDAQRCTTVTETLIAVLRVFLCAGTEGSDWHHRFRMGVRACRDVN